MARNGPDYFSCDACQRFMDYHAIAFVRTDQGVWHIPQQGMSLASITVHVCSNTCRAIIELKAEITDIRSQLARLWKLH